VDAAYHDDPPRGPVSRSTTIDFIDILSQLHFAAAGHFEATYEAWTGFLDVYYTASAKARPGTVSP
jgi:hypothetical protein